MRILERELAFKDLVSRVLAVDYIGALFASLLFPLVFVPLPVLMSPPPLFLNTHPTNKRI
jgi:spermidine synthase